MHGGECRELAVTEPVVAMVMQGELTIAPFDTGAAALAQIGAFCGHLFEALTLRDGQRLEGMLRLAQGLQALSDQGPQSVARLGVGGTLGHAVEVNRGDQWFGERRFQRRGKIQGLDLGGQGSKEKGEGGQQLSGHALGFREAFMRSAGQVGRRRNLLESRPDGANALGDLFHGLDLSGREIVGVIQRTPFTHALMGVGLSLLGLLLVAFALHQNRQGALRTRREVRGAATGSGVAG